MAAIMSTKQGSWGVQIRRCGKYASRTFRLKGQAEQWAREVEHAIDLGGDVSTPLMSKATSLAHLVDLHIADLGEVGKPIRRSKRAVHEALRTDLGRLQLRNINRVTLVDYGKRRARLGAGPARAARFKHQRHRGHLL